MATVDQFYDSFAETYHLIFEDWDSTIARQAQIIDALLESKRTRSGRELLDCACGIGTQALGLAGLGYTVSGSDLSHGAVQRAIREAEARRLAIDFRVSDMTALAEYSSHQFDILAAFDNALPHLSVSQLAAAAQTFHRVLRRDGLFVASIRDYDALIESRPQFQGPAFYHSSGSQRIVHQVWEWTATDAYDVHQYVTLLQDGDWRSLHFASHYRCLLRAELTKALRAASFVDVEWLMPATTGWYQPIVVGRAS